MVTVGYGDLTPNNFVEAIIVTLIQIVGTAIFGYMINVIGLTVNEIQKKNL
jgi:predicted HTH domain antitoxin